MQPSIVTITGADEGVNLKDMIEVTKQYPFVEWGLLVSEKRSGSSRYPSKEWILRASKEISDKLDPAHVALHLCGSDARNAMEGLIPKWILDLPHCVQINGYMPGQAEALTKLTWKQRSLYLVLQCRSEDTLQACADDAESMFNSTGVLFDPSGGRGIAAERWPPKPSGCVMGYAGGIGPDNVLEVIAAIDARSPYWIDMETGVRTYYDQFDMSKVRKVLEQVDGLNEIQLKCLCCGKRVVERYGSTTWETRGNRGSDVFKLYPTFASFSERLVAVVCDACLEQRKDAVLTAMTKDGVHSDPPSVVRGINRLLGDNDVAMARPAKPVAGGGE